MNREKLRLTEERHVLYKWSNDIRGGARGQAVLLRAMELLMPDSQQAQARRYDCKRGGILTRA